MINRPGKRKSDDGFTPEGWANFYGFEMVITAEAEDFFTYLEEQLAALPPAVWYLPVDVFSGKKYMTILDGENRNDITLTGFFTIGLLDTRFDSKQGEMIFFSNYDGYRDREPKYSSHVFHWEINSPIRITGKRIFDSDLLVIGKSIPGHFQFLQLVAKYILDTPWLTARNFRFTGGSEDEILKGLEHLQQYIHMCRLRHASDGSPRDKQSYMIEAVDFWESLKNDELPHGPAYERREFLEVNADDLHYLSNSLHGTFFEEDDFSQYMVGWQANHKKAVLLWRQGLSGTQIAEIASVGLTPDGVQNLISSKRKELMEKYGEEIATQIIPFKKRNRRM